MVKPQTWITIDQYALHFNISTRTVRRWIAAGKIEGARMSDRVTRVKASELRKVPR